MLEILFWYDEATYGKINKGNEKWFIVIYGVFIVSIWAWSWNKYCLWWETLCDGDLLLSYDCVIVLIYKLASVLWGFVIDCACFYNDFFCLALLHSNTIIIYIRIYIFMRSNTVLKKETIHKIYKLFQCWDQFCP